MAAGGSSLSAVSWATDGLYHIITTVTVELGATPVEYSLGTVARWAFRIPSQRSTK